jgi:threonine/homoserine/homoserine lactone efflux protein
MLHVLALVIPLGLAGAISPVLLTEQTMVLASPNGRRSARWFAIGAIAALTVWIAALILFGRSISLPKEPHLSASVDVAVGALLLALGAYFYLRQPKEKVEKPPRSGMNTRAALLFGLVSMATNFSTLALVIPGAKEIAASDIGIAERGIVAIVLIALASIPAWLPLALTAIAPGPAERGLKSFGDFIQRSGRLATVVLLSGVGVFLVIRGILRLA